MKHAKIYAPFTAEQVERLNLYQHSPFTHPFTCGSGNRFDSKHQEQVNNHPSEDYGQLVATVNGWRCPVCDYRQNWAHAWMAEKTLEERLS